MGRSSTRSRRDRQHQHREESGRQDRQREDGALAGLLRSLREGSEDSGVGSLARLSLSFTGATKMVGRSSSSLASRASESISIERNQVAATHEGGVVGWCIGWFASRGDPRAAASWASERVVLRWLGDPRRWRWRRRHLERASESIGVNQAAQ